MNSFYERPNSTIRTQFIRVRSIQSDFVTEKWKECYQVILLFGQSLVNKLVQLLRKWYFSTLHPVGYHWKTAKQPSLVLCQIGSLTKHSQLNSLYNVQKSLTTPLELSSQERFSYLLIITLTSKHSNENFTER